jgi:hypothetical protein
MDKLLKKVGKAMYDMNVEAWGKVHEETNWFKFVKWAVLIFVGFFVVSTVIQILFGVIMFLI